MSDVLVDSMRLFALVGQDDGTVNGRADEVLRQASNLVRRWGNPDWTVEDVPPRAADIALQVAYRTYTNPDGASQKSVGDLSVSFSRTGLQGAMYLTKDEKRDLRRLSGISAATVTLVSPWSGDEEDES
jgi:hypothetical protein